MTALQVQDKFNDSSYIPGTYYCEGWRIDKHPRYGVRVSEDLVIKYFDSLSKKEQRSLLKSLNK